MKRTMTSRSLTAIAAASLALLAGAAQSTGARPAPQGESTPGAGPAPQIKPSLPELPSLSDPREEMIELFRKVETRLNEIDKLLYDASAGERSLKGAALDSGMSELLKSSRSKSQEVVSGIDRILEIAKEQGGSCSSAGSGSPKSGSGSPQSPSQGEQGQPQQGAQDPQQRESTPDRPGGREQQPQGPDPRSDSDPQGGDDPRSPKESGGVPENTAGGPPPGLERARVDPGRDADRWGELPEQYRELFRTEGGGDLPPQYRDWIDAYHRRLNRRR